MKKLVVVLIFSVFCFALPFGTMGQTPASVGGAGVAYKKNAWAIYYNPAILGSNRDSSVAYSFNAGFSELNIADLANIDINNVKNLSDKIKNAFSGTPTTITTRAIMPRATAANGIDWNNLGELTSVLKKYVGGNTTTTTLNEAEIVKKLCGCNGTGGTTGCDCNDQCTLADLKPEQLNLNQIKQDLVQAADNANSPLISGILKNIDENKIDKIMKAIGNGNDMEKLLSGMIDAAGGIKLSKGSDANLNRAIDDLNKIQQTLDNNAIRARSESGLAFHIGGNKSRGAIGAGVLMSANLFAQINNEFIIKFNNENYKISANGDSITIQKANGGSSLLDSVNLITNNLALIEVPIAYGHSIPLFAGDLHIGGSLKYIHAFSSNDAISINPSNANLDTSSLKNIVQTSTFGIDLGALYTLDFFSIGIVGKNLNAPRIKTAHGSFALNPQFRAGVGFEVWKLTFLADIDLMPNESLNPREKSQVFAGGAILDAKWVDFRLGAMYDFYENRNLAGKYIKNPYGVIITAGMNIFHFFDISIQTSTKTTVIDKYRLPNYFDIRIGGRFQW